MRPETTQAGRGLSQTVFRGHRLKVNLRNQNEKTPLGSESGDVFLLRDAQSWLSTWLPTQLSHAGPDTWRQGLVQGCVPCVAIIIVQKIRIRGNWKEFIGQRILQFPA